MEAFLVSWSPVLLYRYWCYFNSRQMTGKKREANHPPHSLDWEVVANQEQALDSHHRHHLSTKHSLRQWRCKCRNWSTWGRSQAKPTRMKRSRRLFLKSSYPNLFRLCPRSSLVHRLSESGRAILPHWFTVVYAIALLYCSINRGGGGWGLGN